MVGRGRGGAAPRRAPGKGIRARLSPREMAAALRFIHLVRVNVPAELEQTSLFGSRARGDARPDSDLDILLVFRWLPEDREPQASIAEELASRVAVETGVPVTTWSVSLTDLERGRRTPMLVDALHDSVPLWWRAGPLPPVPFTPQDALWCTERLLTRVREGSDEFAWRLRRGDLPGAVRRARDDVVRLCTAGLLLRRITRPRRAAAVLAFAAAARGPHIGIGSLREVLDWAADSFGPEGRDEEHPVPPPPCGLGATARAIDRLVEGVEADARALRARVAGSVW